MKTNVYFKKGPIFEVEPSMAASWTASAVPEVCSINTQIEIWESKSLKVNTSFWPQRRFTNDNEILFLSTHGKQDLWLDGWSDWYYFNNDNNVWCLYQFGSWSQTTHQWIQSSKLRYRSQQYIYSSNNLSIVNFLWVIGLDARIYSF